jgi:hypothetical protein
MFDPKSFERVAGREAALREQAREVELDPLRRDEAAQLFRKADRHARWRIRLAAKLGLL